MTTYKSLILVSVSFSPATDYAQYVAVLLRLYRVLLKRVGACNSHQYSMHVHFRPPQKALTNAWTWGIHPPLQTYRWGDSHDSCPEALAPLGEVLLAHHNQARWRRAGQWQQDHEETLDVS